jgi:hypothetical protein
VVEKQIRVALYGSSLFLSGIERSLRAEPGLDVIHLQPDAPDECLLREVMDASLLAFDIHEASPELMLACSKPARFLALIESDRPGALRSGIRRSNDWGSSRSSADMVNCQPYG